jgi:hypothetical protein
LEVVVIGRIDGVDSSVKSLPLQLGDPDRTAHLDEINSLRRQALPLVLLPLARFFLDFVGFVGFVGFHFMLWSRFKNYAK